MGVKIKRRMFLLGLVMMLLAVGVTVLLFDQVFSQQIQQDLRIMGVILAEAYEAEGEDATLEWCTQADIRLSLISEDGDVLYDSEAEEGTLENHAGRPEVVQALATGEGKDRRRSTTLSANTFYYAIRLSDGNILRISEDADSIYSMFDKMLVWILVLLVLLALFSGFLTRHLTRLLVAPIVEMGEHLDEAEAFLPYPELAPLARALSEDRDIRENNEKIRRDFTANVSHELKTPLTTISGYAELISTGMARGEDVPGFASQIQTEVQRMTALVSDIIQLTELDTMSTAPEIALEVQDVDLMEIAQKVCKKGQINAMKNKITLICQGNSTMVQGNEGMLEELCQNLVENAVRYNRPGGKVVVTAGTEQGSPFLRVWDNGIGIPKESQSRVFERFYRVDKSRSKEKGGTGLGLAIVKHIALLHKAKIELISQVGNGTEMTVRFPPT